MEISITNFEIIKAIVNAQKQIGLATRASKNEYVGYTYADINSIINTIKDALTDNDLIVSQGVNKKPDNTLELQTIIMHTSGEYIKNYIPITVDIGKGHPMAQLGSSITYARRYALLSILGIATGDENDVDKDFGENERTDLYNRLCNKIESDTFFLTQFYKNETYKRIQIFNQGKRTNALNIKELKNLEKFINEKKHLTSNAITLSRIIAKTENDKIEYPQNKMNIEANINLWIAHDRELETDELIEIDGYVNQKLHLQDNTN